MNLHLPITVCIICSCFSGLAQKDTLQAIPELALHAHVGRLVKIHGEYPATGISSVHEFSILWKTQGKKDWHAAHGFPSAGISVMHAQYGNQEILGQSLGVVPMMRFEKKHNRFMFSLRAGLGIAWFNKPYDAIENPRNLVIGSRLANMSQLALTMHYQLTQQWTIHIGGSFTHCSGAHMTVPNIGANLPAIFVGMAYHPHQTFISTPRHKTITRDKKTFIGFQMITGFHEFPGTIRPSDGPRYIVYGGGIQASKTFNNRGKVNTGINVHYYTAYADYIHSQELIGSNHFNTLDPFNVVLFAGYEWTYGRVAFFLQGGINLYDPVLRALNEVWDLPKHGWLHQYTANKIGYRIYRHRVQSNDRSNINPYLHVAVKSNGGTADFLEIALGLDFKLRRSK
jgi:hypothetical protein